MARLTLKNEAANYYADHIIKYGMSIREVAKEVSVSKTKVHIYLRRYVTGISRKCKLEKQLAINKSEGYKKGGEVTRLKYLANNL